MTCRVSGTPMPSVSFFHDSKNIDEDEEFVISYNPETGEVTLIIVEVFPEDQGQYICVAENPAGHATTSAYLSVLETKETTMELEVDQPQHSKAYYTQFLAASKCDIQLSRTGLDAFGIVK
ncbi:myosin light chain kinase, smooth muscle [Plakobranchus ocellatus]|uniref:Myosin light chain kinase, smooth muscle n=1 Tax=Plakobranchus ocellatus TaxID=259542 RepID=A0AAV4BWE1_9GAST|nr:myosin light chain kinase, smooth muscle [Plakobranchus ocellatus]